MSDAVNPIRRGDGGFTLIEVAIATTVFALLASVIVQYALVVSNTRHRINARCQAIVAAHSRCEQFAAGEIYDDVAKGLAGNETTTLSTPAGDTPPEVNGYALVALTDTITAGPAGSRYATIVVHYTVETADAMTAEATATGFRSW